MSEWSGQYIAGRPYAICDRCDRKLRLDELKVEWTGLKVCARCHDPRPVHLSAPFVNLSEGAAIPDSRPALNTEATDADLEFPYRDGSLFTPE